MKRRISGCRVSMDTWLLAMLVDYAATWLWRYAPSGTPKPPSMADALTAKEEPSSPIRRFASGKDFQAALNRFLH